MLLLGGLAVLCTTSFRLLKIANTRRAHLTMTPEERDAVEAAGSPVGSFSAAYEE